MSALTRGEPGDRRGGLQAGKTLEELQAAGVGEEWSGYSWGFISTERWVATLHRELTER